MNSIDFWYNYLINQYNGVSMLVINGPRTGKTEAIRKFLDFWAKNPTIRVYKQIYEYNKYRT